MVELILLDVHPTLQDLPDDLRGLGLVDYNWQASNFTVNLIKSALSRALREWVDTAVKHLKSDALVNKVLAHVRISLNPSEGSFNAEAATTADQGGGEKVLQSSPHVEQWSSSEMPFIPQGPYLIGF